MATSPPVGPAPHVRVITLTVRHTRATKNAAARKALEADLAAFTLVRHEIVPDIPGRIREIVDDALAEVDAVVVTGGTGIGPRDVTLETLETLFDKRLDGFGEAFRRLSWD